MFRVTTKTHIEGAREILAKEMTRARLQGPAVLHERFDRICVLSTGETLAGRFRALNHGHGEEILRSCHRNRSR